MSLRTACVLMSVFIFPVKGTACFIGLKFANKYTYFFIYFFFFFLGGGGENRDFPCLHFHNG